MKNEASLYNIQLIFSVYWHWMNECAWYDRETQRSIHGRLKHQCDQGTVRWRSQVDNKIYCSSDDVVSCCPMSQARKGEKSYRLACWVSHSRAKMRRKSVLALLLFAGFFPLLLSFKSFFSISSSMANSWCLPFIIYPNDDDVAGDRVEGSDAAAADWLRMPVAAVGVALGAKAKITTAAKGPDCPYWLILCDY